MAIEFEQVTDQWGNFRATTVATVSGGQFVKALSVGEASTSRMDEILQVDLADGGAGDSLLCVGIATNNAASGEEVTVATRGIFKTFALGTCLAGATVAAAADSSVQDAVIPAVYQCLGSAVAMAADTTSSVGRALNTAVSGEKVFILMNVGGF